VSALAGRTALVTGSSRGIGAQIARVFAAAGARVAVHGRDEVAVAATLASIRAENTHDCMAVIGDVTSYAHIERMRGEIEQQLGPVDVLVTNAGGSPVRPGPIEELTEEGWHASLDANLTSTFLLLKAFLPGMKARGTGSIVTMSSAAARRPSAHSPFAYAAAKAGVELLTKDAAAQAGPAGVRVNCLAPETIMTERNTQQIPAEMQEQLRAQHPVQRLGTPDDVAQAALFLAADTASWISGVVLDVAGGAVLV
jgi:3-oxoacyl-[acyl-carrier protein] reductase